MRNVATVVSLLVLSIPAWGLAFVVRHLPSSSIDRSLSLRTPSETDGFVVPTSSSKETLLREEASTLLQKAKTLRRQIPEPSQQELTYVVGPLASKWRVPLSADNGVGYRLYVDIGREEGTWMDPRWGASQRRIEFTLDVEFCTAAQNKLASRDLRDRMVPDNFGGSSSSVYCMKVASVARLRSGFAEMHCHDEGAYRLDMNQGTLAANTIRFLISTQGTAEANDNSFGDVYVPKGDLYFSLPAFGNGTQQLSKKAGVVSVRQMGWHTGWRRLSRIVGIFRVIPIEEARSRDGF